jgi:hypothetical protein
MWNFEAKDLERISFTAIAIADWRTQQNKTLPLTPHIQIMLIRQLFIGHRITNNLKTRRLRAML